MNITRMSFPTASLRDAATHAEASLEHARTLLSAAPVVIFGAGGLGRRLLDGLRHHGISAAAFIDNDRRRWNTTVDGVRIIGPEEAAAAYGDHALFIIGIWNAGRRRNQSEVRDQLRTLGCRNVVSFAHVFRCFPETFLPYFAIDRFEHVLSASSAIEEAYDLLEDERSRRIFAAQIQWRITFDFDGLSSPGDEPQYFPPDVYRLRTDESFVDCGAFDGDTLRQFLSLTNGELDHYWALEPDAANYETLRSFVGTLTPAIASRITCLPLAASDRNGTERFDSRGSASSVLSESGEVTIECRPLDEIIPACTIIKLDVEGAEPRVLLGARRLIADQAPVLALSAYHLQSHIWELPLLVRSLNPRYAFVYREHNEEGFDLVLYAVPRERQP